MFYEKYQYFKKKNNSVLAVGLDSDINKIGTSSIFDFNKRIIDKTKENVCAFKLNIAFYEEAGEPGIKDLKKTVDYISKFEIPVILDAKRGDISNTAKAYARAYFGKLKVDSITISPYMGTDSMIPYLEMPNSHIFVVALSSNPGAIDFEIPNSLYLKVGEKASKLNEIYKNRVGIVVGATQNNFVTEVAKLSKDLMWLVPGIGYQGGSLEDFFKFSSGHSNVVINSSRGIIFSKDPAVSSKNLKDKINIYRRKYEN